MKRLGRGLDVLLACAVAWLAVDYLMAAGEEPTNGPKPLTVPWTELVQASQTIGSGEVAFLTVIDYECPACRRFHIVVEDFLRQYPSRSVGILHSPRSGNIEARHSAVTIACLGHNGSFAEAHRRMLGSPRPTEQDDPAASRQNKPRCEESEGTAVVQQHQDLARRLGVVGTPSVVFRDSMYTGGMGPRALRDRVARSGVALPSTSHR